MTASRDVADLRRDLATIDAANPTVELRAEAILRQLGRRLPFDAGWLALRDPERHRHHPLATTGAAEPLREYFGRPDADDEVERLGLNAARAPMLAAEVPVPLSDVAAWADHLLPAGFQNGVASGLFTARGRHVGFLSLVSADRSRPTPADRDLIAAVTTPIAAIVDRTRDIGETARAVEAATAGVVLSRGGDVLALPGLPGHSVLQPDSPALIVAVRELATAGPDVVFLCPVGGPAGRLIRVRALDLARPDLDHLTAAVLVSPPGDLPGLTVTELRLLGLVVEGVTDRAHLAWALQLTPQAVAAALERSLAALGTRDVTTAAVRALRRGWRIPPGCGPRRTS